MNFQGIEKSKGHIAFATFPYSGVTVEFFLYDGVAEHKSLLRAPTSMPVAVDTGYRTGLFDSHADFRLEKRLAQLRRTSTAWEGEK